MDCGVVDSTNKFMEKMDMDAAVEKDLIALQKGRKR